MMLARLSTKSLIDICVGWPIMNVLQFLITDKKTYRPSPITKESIGCVRTLKRDFFHWYPIPVRGKYPYSYSFLEMASP